MVEAKPSIHEDADTVLCNDFGNVIFVRYLDHVMYNRASALAMKPQIRKTVGWLVYDCDQYITIKWDCDDEPPTLHGGDAKASGLVLLKSDILEFKRLNESLQPLKENLKWHLNSQAPTLETEFALQANEAKNSNRQRKSFKGEN